TQQGSQPSSRFRGGPQPTHGESIGALGFVFFSALLINLPQMIAHLAVMAQSPGSRNIFLSLVEIALGKMDPTQRVPIRNQRSHERQVLLRKAVERQIAKRRSRGRD